MANNEIIIKNDLRPCYVNGTKALFHKWIEKEQPVIKISCYSSGTKEYAKRIFEFYKENNVISPDCELHKIKETVAIVELEDGTIQEVKPTDIKFCDNKIKEYCFN